MFDLKTMWLCSHMVFICGIQKQDLRNVVIYLDHQIKEEHKMMSYYIAKYIPKMIAHPESAPFFIAVGVSVAISEYRKQKKTEH